jgi:hypothetical protein
MKGGKLASRLAAAFALLALGVPRDARGQTGGRLVHALGLYWPDIPSVF